MSEQRISRRSIVATAAALPLVAVAGAAPAEAVQGNMLRAIEALQQARASLQAASANKGGHRRKAIDLVDAAIREVNLGIEAGES